MIDFIWIYCAMNWIYCWSWRAWWCSDISGAVRCLLCFSQDICGCFHKSFFFLYLTNFIKLLFFLHHHSASVHHSVCLSSLSRFAHILSSAISCLWQLINGSDPSFISRRPAIISFLCLLSLHFLFLLSLCFQTFRRCYFLSDSFLKKNVKTKSAHALYFSLALLFVFISLFLCRNPSCEVHQEPVSLNLIDSSLQDTLPQCINTRCSQRYTSRYTLWYFVYFI